MWRMSKWICGLHSDRMYRCGVFFVVCWTEPADRWYTNAKKRRRKTGGILAVSAKSFLCGFHFMTSFMVWYLNGIHYFLRRFTLKSAKRKLRGKYPVLDMKVASGFVVIQNKKYSAKTNDLVKWRWRQNTPIAAWNIKCISFCKVGPFIAGIIQFL